MDANKKILIVDDEPLNIKLLAAMLSEFKYEILTAPDGVEAIEQTYANSPDLILLDIMMPKMNGYEVTRKLKEDHQTQHIPIILTTALEGANLKTIGHEAGADDFLNKPINIAELRSRVKSHLSLKEYNDRVDILKKGTIEFEKNEKDFLLKGEDPQSIIIAIGDQKEAKLVDMYLYGQPFKMEPIKTFKDAVACAENDQADLILLDLNLARGGDPLISKRLEDIHKDRHVQILAICGSGDLDTDVSDIVGWADDFLTRPINVHELRARVSALLKKKSLYDTFYANANDNIHSVVIDRLTGLYNRGYFEHFLYREIKKAQRYKVPVALMILKMDGAQEVSGEIDGGESNSFYGTLGNIIRNNIREVDIGARCSEEMFAVVLPNTNIEGSKIVFERFKQLIREQYGLEDLKPRIQSLKIGISGCPDHGDDLAQLVDMAERSASLIFDNSMVDIKSIAS
jgi:two-component system, cell cycle response regulator